MTRMFGRRPIIAFAKPMWFTRKLLLTLDWARAEFTCPLERTAAHGRP